MSACLFRTQNNNCRLNFETKNISNDEIAHYSLLLESNIDILYRSDQNELEKIHNSYRKAVTELFMSLFYFYWVSCMACLIGKYR